MVSNSAAKSIILLAKQRFINSISDATIIVRRDRAKQTAKSKREMIEDGDTNSIE